MRGKARQPSHKSALRTHPGVPNGEYAWERDWHCCNISSSIMGASTSATLHITRLPAALGLAPKC
jgi:hypothetical protein